MHQSKLLLERYSAGETDENESRCIEKHCQTCSDCAGYLETLTIRRQQFLAVHPYVRFRQNSEPIPGQPWYRSFFSTLSRPALLPAFGCIAILLMLSPIIYFAGIRHAARDAIVFKGGDALSFLLKRNGRVSQCTPGDTVYPGDEMQVLYSTARGGYISLLSVDSYGAISWYHPEAQGPFCSVPATSGGKRTYPSAVLLDTSKGRELFVALFSDAPLSRDVVQRWVAGAIKKTNTDLFLLERELDSTRGSVRAAPVMALFQKGN